MRCVYLTLSFVFCLLSTLSCLIISLGFGSAMCACQAWRLHKQPKRHFADAKKMQRFCTCILSESLVSSSILQSLRDKFKQVTSHDYPANVPHQFRRSELYKCSLTIVRAEQFESGKPRGIFMAA